ncbi:MAG: 6-phosphogluconolactonase [Amphiamblys sp. WSBS2006]|nr:MAG: 6-phosphogluconolactonase [Amphiamblys sp. WSBS2006]
MAISAETQSNHEVFWEVFETVDELREGLFRRIEEEWERREKELFRVALSGGSIISVLSARKFYCSTSMDYTKWRIGLADERFVPPTHVDSNYRHITQRLTGGESRIPVQNIYGVDCLSYGDPERAAIEYEKRLSSFISAQSFYDLALLGVGEDGHICSLFPGDLRGEEEDCAYIGIYNSPRLPARRITLTQRAIERIDTVFFVVIGEEKRDVVRRIYDGEKGSLPVNFASPKTKIRWFVTKEVVEDKAGRTANKQ